MTGGGFVPNACELCARYAEAYGVPPKGMATFLWPKDLVLPETARFLSYTRLRDVRLSLYMSQEGLPAKANCPDFTGVDKI